MYHTLLIQTLDLSGVFGNIPISADVTSPAFDWILSPVRLPIPPPRRGNSSKTYKPLSSRFIGLVTMPVVRSEYLTKISANRHAPRLADFRVNPLQRYASSLEIDSIACEPPNFSFVHSGMVGPLEHQPQIV
jgi:hypothetical protein